MNDAIDTTWSIPVAFYFMVTIGKSQIAFKEVSGLSTEMELETIQEGGVNEYEHRLPKQVKHGNLVLKRTLMPLKDNEVVSWIRDVLEGGLCFDVTGRKLPITRNIQVTLLSIKSQAEGEKDATIPLYKWECINAFPVKWEVDTLDAEKNSVLIETLEFAYSGLKRIDK